jgi:multiple sugar transport system permease protein
MAEQTLPASGSALSRPSLLERLDDFRREYLWCFIFIAPLVILVSVFLLYPLVHAFIISFQKFTISRDQSAQWVGLANFAYTLKNPVWQRALLNTAVYTLVNVTTGIAISLALAWLIFPLNAAVQNFFKAAYYLPAHIGGIMVALVWYWMFDPMAGLLNYLIGLGGAPMQLWIKDPRTTLGISNALWSMTLIPILGGHGGGVILYLAAMGNIPKTLYEAADIDAASAWAKFARITWPLLKPTTLFVLITSTIGSFQVFEFVYLLTRGGPNFGTITVVYQIYVEAFERYQFGMASAQAFLLAALIVSLSLIQFRLLRSDVEY